MVSQWNLFRFNIFVPPRWHQDTRLKMTTKSRSREIEIGIKPQNSTHKNFILLSGTAKVLHICSFTHHGKYYIFHFIETFRSYFSFSFCKVFSVLHCYYPTLKTVFCLNPISENTLSISFSLNKSSVGRNGGQ